MCECLAGDSPSANTAETRPCGPGHVRLRHCTMRRPSLHEGVGFVMGGRDQRTYKVHWSMVGGHKTVSRECCNVWHSARRGGVEELAEGFEPGRLACVDDMSLVVRGLSRAGNAVSVWCDERGVYVAARIAIGAVARGRAAFEATQWPRGGWRVHPWTLIRSRPGVASRGMLLWTSN
jgi:hypothetical protein